MKFPPGMCVTHMRSPWVTLQVTLTFRKWYLSKTQLHTPHTRTLLGTTSKAVTDKSQFQQMLAGRKKISAEIWLCRCSCVTRCKQRQHLPLPWHPSLCDGYTQNKCESWLKQRKMPIKLAGKKGDGIIGEHNNNKKHWLVCSVLFIWRLSQCDVFEILLLWLSIQNFLYDVLLVFQKKKPVKYCWLFLVSKGSWLPCLKENACLQSGWPHSVSVTCPVHFKGKPRGKPVKHRSVSPLICNAKNRWPVSSVSLIVSSALSGSHNTQPRQWRSCCQLPICFFCFQFVLLLEPMDVYLTSTFTEHEHFISNRANFEQAFSRVAQMWCAVHSWWGRKDATLRKVKD